MTRHIRLGCLAILVLLPMVRGTAVASIGDGSIRLLRPVGETPSVAELTIDADALARARSARGPFEVRDVPLRADLNVDLRVERFSITSPRTRFMTGRRGGDRADAAFDPGRVTLLRGVVRDRPGSSVYLAVSDEGALGTIDTGPGAARFTLGPGGSGARGLSADGLRFDEVGGFGVPPLVDACGVAAPSGAAPPPAALGSAPAGTTPRRIEIAVETDFEYFELFDDVDAANSYVIALYGAIAQIYARDLDAILELSFVRIWDEPENLYDVSDPLPALRDHWESSETEVARDVVQLLTGRRDLPYGGVAYIEGLCGDLGYSVNGYILGSFVDPGAPSGGNWDIIVCAHELGHNCGTLHTHDYGIDAGATGTVQRGTIMSYCHTTSGGASNIDMRFHGEIAPIVKAFTAGLACLTVDCNGNGSSDADDIAGGAADNNGNGVPDECEDCNGNGTLDSVELMFGQATDADGNGRPDACDPDCNGNGVPDAADIATGGSVDLYGDGVPDECEADCNGNGLSDYTEIQLDMSLDLDRNAVLDACQDCDGDGTTDLEIIAGGLDLWVAAVGLPGVRQFSAVSGVPVRDTAGAGFARGDDLVIGPDGSIFVSDPDGHRVVRFDRVTGAVLGDFVAPGLGGLGQPAGLLFTASAGLLVASRDTDSVIAYDATTGALLGTLVAPGAGGLVEPFGMALAPSGDLLVTSDDARVLRYDVTTGGFLGGFVAAGSGGLSAPRGMLMTPDDRVLVCSFETDAVLAYGWPGGDFLGQFDRGGLDSGFWGLNRPWGARLSATGDAVFVSSHEGNAAVHSYELDTGLFLRSYYVLAQDIGSPTGFDIAPAGGADCNLNLQPDGCEIAAGMAADCDGNGVPDACDIAAGTAADADGDGVPDQCACPTDVTGDGATDIDDIVAVVLAWGACGGCPADVNGDGAIDIDDLVDVVLAFGSCP